MQVVTTASFIRSGMAAKGMPVDADFALAFARRCAQQPTPRIRAMADMALEAARMIRAGAADHDVEAFCKARVASAGSA